MNDNGMLTDEDRRKVRDVARRLIDELDTTSGTLALSTDGPDRERLTVEVRNLAAAIEHLDRVSRGPVR